MNWLSGLFSKQDELNDCTTTACEQTSACVLTGRLTSPGSRIVIQTTEDKQLYLSKGDLLLIKSLHRMTNDLKVDSNGEVTISVPICLSAEQLDKIVLWCRLSHENGSQSPLRLVESIFCPNNKTDIRQLLKFIEIAQFLDIGQLVESLSQRVATCLEKMDIDTMRKALGREGKPPCTAEQLDAIAALKEIFKSCEKTEDKVQ